MSTVQTINPDYKKPPDYNEPTIKITDKVMIPQVWILNLLSANGGVDCDSLWSRLNYSTKYFFISFVFQDDHPGLNFMGLLIGPRGNTLKAMEKVLFFRNTT